MPDVHVDKVNMTYLVYPSQRRTDVLGEIEGALTGLDGIAIKRWEILEDNGPVTDQVLERHI